MFKKRSLQVSVVKNAKTTETSNTHPRLGDPEIQKIQKVALGVGVFLLGSAVTLKFTDAICEIAVNYTPKK